MALTKVKLIADGVIVQSNLDASHGITTTDIGEGSNLYYTDARARAAVSVSGNALSYNSSTGVITSNFEESPTFTGNVVIDGTLDVNGTEILVGTNNTRLAENNLRFKAASDAYIDQNTVSQAIRFRTSSSSSLDTTPIIIAAGGVTTFSTDVHVGGATAARFKSDGTNTIVDAIPGSSSIIFRNSGAVEKMRLDSSGNLGINDTNPSGASGYTYLTINNTSNGAAISFKESGSERAAIYYTNSTNLFNIYATETGSQLVFGTNAAERMRIDSGGDVYIKGQANPTLYFQTNSTTTTNMFLIEAASYVGTAPYNTNRLIANNSSNIAFETGGSERMRIDSSGRVFINSGQSWVETFIDKGLRIKGSRAGTILESSGTLATHVMVAGSNSSTAVHINHNSAGHLSFYQYSAGKETLRLHESGGITFNGDTAAANALDDYEEGSWSPQVYYQNATDQSNATNTVQEGKYTKIGNLVYVSFRLDFSQSGTPANDNIGVKNLPFAGANNHYGAGGNLVTTTSIVGLNFQLPAAGSTQAVIINSANAGNYGDEFGTGSGRFIRGSFTYLAQ